MISIPVNADVFCTDGACGKSGSVIINPLTRKVTHFIVRDVTSKPAVKRLVPMEEVAETTSNQVRLRCAKDALAGMQPFIEKRFVQHEMPYYVDTVAYNTPMVVPRTEDIYTIVEEKRIPPGELEIYRGMDVEAKDGHVGDVGEFLVDPASGEISHLVLEKGHLFGKKDMALPVSAVDHVQEETVYLKLDKRAIGALPAIPIMRPWAETSITEVELMISTFDETDKAEEALHALMKLDREEDFDILNAAVLVKDADGKTSFKETGDVDAKRGTVFGAITGGLFGLVGGPVGVVVGAVAGAAAGRVAANKIDMGFPDEFLKSTQQALKPGSSAIVVLVEQEWATEVAKSLAQFKGNLVEQTIPDEMVNKVLQAIESQEHGDQA